MKVDIGPYKGWASAHSWLNRLRRKGWLADPGYEEDWADWVADKLQTVINLVWNKPRERFPRKTKVHIDLYDVWNLDHTLSLIIAPALKVMKEDKRGAPYVDMEDVPEELREVIDKKSSNEGKLHFERWDYVLGEMIWAFDQKLLDDWCDQYHDNSRGEFDMVGMNKHQERISNGLRLFGKYFEGLWT
jgi:hypothetical protein